MPWIALPATPSEEVTPAGLLLSLVSGKTNELSAGDRGPAVSFLLLSPQIACGLLPLHHHLCLAGMSFILRAQQIPLLSSSLPDSQAQGASVAHPLLGGRLP